MEIDNTPNFGDKAREASLRVKTTCLKYGERLKDYELKHIRDTLRQIIGNLHDPKGHTEGIYVAGRDSETPMANTSKSISAFIRHYNRYHRSQNVSRETKNEIIDNLTEASKFLGKILFKKRAGGGVSEHKIITSSLEYMNGTCHNWERPFSQPL